MIRKQGTERNNLAEELYAHQNDPEEWNEEAESIEVRPARTAVLSVRIPLNELDTLEQEAEAAGESLSEYVRRAIMQRFKSKPMSTGVNASYGTPENVEHTWTTWTTGTIQSDLQLVKS